MIHAAAIKTKDGRVWILERPARHHDILRKIARETGEAVRGETQGFVDGDFRFLTRAAALVHALAHGQVSAKDTGMRLYTEDLW